MTPSIPPARLRPRGPPGHRGPLARELCEGSPRPAAPLMGPQDWCPRPTQPGPRRSPRAPSLCPLVPRRAPSTVWSWNIAKCLALRSSRPSLELDSSRGAGAGKRPWTRALGRPRLALRASGLRLPPGEVHGGSSCQRAFLRRPGGPRPCARLSSDPSVCSLLKSAASAEMGGRRRLQGLRRAMASGHTSLSSSSSLVLGPDVWALTGPVGTGGGAR